MQPRYDIVFCASNHTAKAAGNIHAYFRDRSAKFVAFATGSQNAPQGSVAEVYEHGRLVRTHEYRWHFGGKGPLRNVAYYLQFLHARLFLTPSRAKVLVHIPLYCIGHSVFRFLRDDVTAFWVWDFYDRPNKTERLFNALSDWYVARMPTVLFISQAIMDVYAAMVRRRAGAEWILVPLGIRAQENPRRPEPGVFGFIGQLKGNAQGLELVMEALRQDAGLRFEIIGAGHALGAMRAYAAAAGVADRVTFHGSVLEEDRLAAIVARWQLGIAAYTASDFIKYSDPGKLKLYWQLGLAVVTTRENPIYKDITEFGGGEVADADAASVLRAIRRIIEAPEKYRDGVRRFQEKFEYERLYERCFSFMDEQKEPRT